MPAPASTRPDGAARQRLPDGFVVAATPGLVVGAGGRVLGGGRPFRLVRLDRPTAESLAPLWAGSTLSVDASNAATLARLVDLDLLRPVPAPDRRRLTEVTVVVPVRDHATALSRLFASPGAFTGVAGVVVVDDGSADAAAVAGAVAGLDGVPVTLVRAEVAGGPAVARNRGAAECSTAFVAFVDADCRPEPGWLLGLLGHFDDPGVGAVAPRVRAEADADAGGGAAMGALAVFDAERGPLDAGEEPGAVGPGRPLPVVPSAALVVRGSAYVAVGGFDAGLRFGEDNDLEWRLAEAGWSVRYEPSSVVRHPVRPGARAALEQRFRYGLPASARGRRHRGFRMLHVEPATALALAAAAAGAGPVPAAGLALGALAYPAGRWAAAGIPWRAALRRRLAEQLADGHGLALAMWRSYWPLTVVAALAHRRFRRWALAALVGPPLVDWARRRPAVGPLSWVVMHVADQVAGGTGVWAGCLRAGRGGVLVPGWTTVATTPRDVAEGT